MPGLEKQNSEERKEKQGLLSRLALDQMNNKPQKKFLMANSGGGPGIKEQVPIDNKKDNKKRKGGKGGNSGDKDENCTIF